MGETNQARTALLVDDSKSARFVLGKLLKRHDFEVEMVDSAEAALSFLENHRPDAIFMDHMMPGMDGLSATSTIKNDPQTSHIPVVMCTSNDGEHYLEEARSHGALATLQKPPVSGQLEEVLKVLECVLQESVPTETIAMTGTDAESFMDGDADGDAQVPRALETGDQGPTQEEVLELVVDSRLSKELEQFENAMLTKLTDQLDSMHDLINRELQSRQEGMTRQEVEAVLDDRLEALRALITGELQSRQEGMPRQEVEAVLDDRLEALQGLITGELQSRQKAMDRQAVETLVNEGLDGQTAFFMQKIADVRSRDSELISSEPFREKVQEMARQEAESATSVMAVGVADGTARSAAKELLDSGLESIAGEFEAKLEQLKHQAFGRAKWYAVFAAIIGMASAAAGYYLGV